ncbi:hypothetical protein DITRI_Ditri17bG0049400 [Diplodiscus trichospermus]
MSSNTNNNIPFWPSWRSGHDHGGYAPNTGNDSNRVDIEPVFRHSISFRTSTDSSRGSRDPWQTPTERAVTRPFSFSGLPDYQRAPTPVNIVWIDNVPARAVNPRFSGPLSRSTAEQHVQLPATPTQQDDFRSNQDEQNSVLSKLKREIYNPIPKQMTRRLSLYYKNQNQSNYNEKGKEKDEDGKRCAICLEDFEAREQVMLTPCDHMFHEECILPWVKSHGQCPVCRFVLSDRIRQTASNNNVSNVPPAELFAGELMSIIRIMEEAFLWGNSR